MASELRVNTLKDSAGNNSIGMSVVANGTAKVWVNFNGTGTVAIRDDTNVGSITDDGTGLYTVNYTSNMSNANYAANFSNTMQNSQINTNANMTTSSISVRTRNNSFTNTDSDTCLVAVQGDLA